MPISIYQKEKIEKLKNQAKALYKEGLSTRKIAAIVNRSHNWVAHAVRELSTSKT